jgi:PAS domain S-box-containing protein
MASSSVILVIDDDAITRETLSALLRADDYQVVLVGDGEQGLAQAARLSPDVILLDVMMPGMDGFEVCRRLRADSQLAEVPILMLTALDNRASRLEGLQAGADDFITKPFDPTELTTRVRTITRLNRYRRLLAERARFARLVEISPNGIAVVDAAGTIRLANQALARLVGVEAGAQLEGQPVRKFVAAAAAESTAGAAAWQKVLSPSAPDVSVETEIVCADGPSFPVELIAGSVMWDGQPAAQIILRDISLEKSRRSEEEAIAEERRRIAREIHDGLAQNLAALRVRAAVWHDLVDQNPAQMHAELNALQDFLRENIHEVRRSIFALRPVVLETQAFYPALRQYLADFGEQNQLQVDWRLVGPEVDLPEDLELALFRILQETLNNVSKHARAASVWVELDVHSPESVALQVRDDGAGFEPGALPRPSRYGHLGLRQMRERVERRGGILTVDSAPGAGATIRVALPVARG